MKKFLSEFKEFAVKGNAFELAVGVIIGAAFKAIIDSIVNNVIMPLVGLMLGGKNFASLSFGFKGAQIQYGLLIESIVNFIIVAFCLFVLVKTANRMRDGFKRKKDAEEIQAPAPAKSDEVVLLEQIRDSLEAINKKQ